MYHLITVIVDRGKAERIIDAATEMEFERWNGN